MRKDHLRRHVPATLGFPIVNPDAIAQALFPEGPAEGAYEAARAADVVRGDLLDRGVSFCMETVFSDPEGAKLAFIERAQREGYVGVLVFIGLESPELAVARVVERVERGMTCRTRRSFRGTRGR